MRASIHIIVITVLSLTSYGLIATEPLDIAIVEYPPYHFTEALEFKGQSVRLVQEAFKRIKTPVHFQVLPWSRALKWLKSGKIDGLVGVFIRNERKLYIDYNQIPLSTAKIHLFVTQDSNIEFDGDLTKLKGYHFGVKQDFSYGPTFDSLVAHEEIANITREVSIEKLLLKLCTGAIDIMVSEKLNSEYLFEQLNSNKSPELKRCKKIIELAPEIDARKAYLALSKKKQHTELIEHFDQALEAMKQDGSFDEIIRADNPSH